jgi:hypothetical protein
MKCLAFLLLAFISFAAAGRASNFFAGDLKPAASEYARAAGLAPLRSTMGFELRVWTRDYMSGRVAGLLCLTARNAHSQANQVIIKERWSSKRPV